MLAKNVLNNFKHNLDKVESENNKMNNLNNYIGNIQIQQNLNLNKLNT